MSERGVDRLMQYTLFHIGVYVSLSTAIVAALAWDAKEHVEEPSGRLFGPEAFPVAVAALIFLGFAGLGAGVVAAKLPYSDSVDDFLKERIGLSPRRSGGLLTASPRFWMTIEHWSFWAALILAASAGLLAAAPGPLLLPHLAWPWSP